MVTLFGLGLTLTSPLVNTTTVLILRGICRAFQLYNITFGCVYGGTYTHKITDIHKSLTQDSSSVEVSQFKYIRGKRGNPTLPCVSDICLVIIIFSFRLKHVPLYLFSQKNSVDRISIKYRANCPPDSPICQPIFFRYRNYYKVITYGQRSFCS